VCVCVCVKMMFEGMEESGSVGFDDLALKLKEEGWMNVRLMSSVLSISDVPSLISL